LSRKSKGKSTMTSRVSHEPKEMKVGRSEQRLTVGERLRQVSSMASKNEDVKRDFDGRLGPDLPRHPNGLGTCKYPLDTTLMG
jgi:hypothetical protein